MGGGVYGFEPQTDKNRSIFLVDDILPSMSLLFIRFEQIVCFGTHLEDQLGMRNSGKNASRPDGGQTSHLKKIVTEKLEQIKPTLSTV